MKQIERASLAIILCFFLALPIMAITGVKAQAATTQATSSKVKIKTMKGVTKNYKQKKKYCYVNGKKIKLNKTPIFFKSGTNMGPVSAIFKKSGLKVTVKYRKNSITLSYGTKSVTVKDGSRYAVSNGKKSLMGASVIHGYYTASGKRRWIVPIRSVCQRLGISYSFTNGVIQISGSANKYARATSYSDTNDNNNNSNNSNNDNNTSSKKIRIVLDAGHGGTDSGATGNGLAEKNLTLKIVLAAKKYFDNDSRFKVYYTRTSDSYPSLSKRCQIANNNNVDMFICVHVNSANAAAHGTETLYNPSRNTKTKKNGLTSKELATAMQKGAVGATGFLNRGLKSRTDLWVLNGTDMPACLIEYGFITNKTESRRMNLNTSFYGRSLYYTVVNLMKSEGRY